MRKLDQELRPTNRRLEAFSDAVFAIVVTVMVLEVQVPDRLANANDSVATGEFASALGAYALSFLVIVNLWTSHHYLVFTIDNPARSTIWFNNVLLFCVSLIPVTTRFLGMFPRSPKAAAAYGLVAALCTISFMLLRSHAARISGNELHRKIHHQVLRRTRLFLAIYLAAIPLAFVSPWLAWACFLIVPPMLFLPVIRASQRSVHLPGDHALERSCP